MNGLSRGDSSNTQGEKQQKAKFKYVTDEEVAKLPSNLSLAETTDQKHQVLEQHKSKKVAARTRFSVLRLYQ